MSLFTIYSDLECQFSACPDRLTMMYPPTYDEATFHSQQKEVNVSRAELFKFYN